MEPNGRPRLQTGFIVYMWALCNVKHPTIYFPKPAISIYQKAVGILQLPIIFIFFFQNYVAMQFLAGKFIKSIYSWLKVQRGEIGIQINWKSKQM